VAGDNEVMSAVPDWARYWRADGMPVEAMHADSASRRTR
jgi:hypothetical protein